MPRHVRSLQFIVVDMGVPTNAYCNAVVSVIVEDVKLSARVNRWRIGAGRSADYPTSRATACQGMMDIGNVYDNLGGVISTSVAILSLV